jgi:hypothetical protein
MAQRLPQGRQQVELQGRCRLRPAASAWAAGVCGQPCPCWLELSLPCWTVPGGV